MPVINGNRNSAGYFNGGDWCARLCLFATQNQGRVELMAVKLSIKDACFSYNDKEPVWENINLAVEEGECLACLA